MQRIRFNGYFQLFFIILLGLTSGSYAKNQQFTLKFSSESIVIGPQIVLGEICEIAVKDTSQLVMIKKLVVGDAAPPGEAREISLSLIKKYIRESGFDLKQINFKGPKIIRITTIQNKLIDLWIDDTIGCIKKVRSKEDFFSKDSTFYVS